MDTAMAFQVGPAQVSPRRHFIYHLSQEDPQHPDQPLPRPHRLPARFPENDQPKDFGSRLSGFHG